MAGQTWDDKPNFAMHVTMPPPDIVLEGEKTYRRVRFADECPPCDCCGEPFCPLCETHYAECECPGPTQDGIEYKEIDGQLYGREET